MNIKVVIILVVLSTLSLNLFLHTVREKKLSFVICAGLLTILSFYLRFLVLDYQTLDYQNFLAHWVDYFRYSGGFSALRSQVGNYNIPYLYFLALFSYSEINDLYLIKLLSIFFDILLAWSAVLLLGRFTDSAWKKLACYFTVFMLPTVFLNGSLWGQCDSTYVALALLGIYCAMDDRPCLSMVLAALSFGFKLQAVFILPLYAVLWMRGKFRLRHFALFPLTYVLLVLPAVIAGRPFLETITLYFNQTGSIGDGLNYNSPSAFSFIQYTLPEAYNVTASRLGIAAAALYMVGVLTLCYVNRDKLNDRATLAAALLFAIGIPFLLPHMHDRYFFCADALSVVLAFTGIEFAAVPLLVQFASLLSYHAYLKMRYLLTMDKGACALLAALALTFVCFFLSIRPNDSEELEVRS